MGSVTVFLGRHPHHRRQLIDNGGMMEPRSRELLRVSRRAELRPVGWRATTQIRGLPDKKGERRS